LHILGGERKWRHGVTLSTGQEVSIGHEVCESGENFDTAACFDGTTDPVGFVGMARISRNGIGHFIVAADG
jgi:hypothetical protein